MRLFNKQRRSKTVPPSEPHPSTSVDAPPEDPLSATLDDNVARIRQQLGSSADMVIREFRHGAQQQIRAAYVYIEVLVNQQYVQDLIEGTMERLQHSEWKPQDSGEKDEQLQFATGDVHLITDFAALYHAILSGATMLLIDGLPEAFAVGTIGSEHRAVSEPTTQTVIRGPQEAFNEVMRTNVSLVRRRLKNPNLWLETRQVGRMTQTDVGLMYIKGLAKESLIQEAKHRLDQISIDSILESGYIEELIQDKGFTIFPTLINSERPDAVAAALLEGRIAIFVDGTPYVLIAPALFTQFFQSPEDYYMRGAFGLLRILRFIAFFLTLFAPSLYIAITTYHQEMLPTTLLIGLAAQREGIPFPAFIEALVMEITFEILREGGVRMPRAVGTSLSIVGALVLGEAAVQAGLVSPAMVIVVSITAISSFLFPSFEIGVSVRMLRFVLMGLAASYGLFGIFVGGLALVLHLCSLKSFGVPYMTPFAPFIRSDQKDNLIRVPWWRMDKRPRLFVEENLVREQTPSPTNRPKS
ncbi:MAG: spore germination protein [Tumebacillaceae bacterium]